jgi:hypothetical protein
LKAVGRQLTYHLTYLCRDGDVELETDDGQHSSGQGVIEFFKTFPDNHLINHPYKVEIAQGGWTCTVADFTGRQAGRIGRRPLVSHMRFAITRSGITERPLLTPLLPLAIPKTCHSDCD